MANVFDAIRKTAHNEEQAKILIRMHLGALSTEANVNIVFAAIFTGGYVK